MQPAIRSAAWFTLGGVALYATRRTLPLIDTEASIFPMKSEGKLHTTLKILGRAADVWPRFTLHTPGVIRFLFGGFVLNFTDPGVWEAMERPKAALTLVSRKPLERAAALVEEYQANGIQARIVDGAEVDFDSTKLVFVAVGEGYLECGNFALVIRRHVLWLALTGGPRSPRPTLFTKQDKMAYAG